MGLFFFRRALFCLVALSGLSARADDILFFGNSFTQGEMAPAVRKHGGVPALVHEIAQAKGRQVAVTAIIAGGQNLGYHLAQPQTEKALGSKVWNWVVLQDYSTHPTAAGSVDEFIKEGETFSDRIAVNSPKAGIVLYETWSRPAGAFYQKPPGNVFSGPDQMMSQVHEAYANLQKDLLAKNPNRKVLVAPVGTAFAEVRAKYPEIVVDANDQHHATAEGYYLAALVIYNTIYWGGAKGAPTQFYSGAVVIPPDVAAKLQRVADDVYLGQYVKMREGEH
jgi:hypothetical protein